MALEFTLDEVTNNRINALGFVPSVLPQEYFKRCDLCGWKIFRTISHVDRYGFPGTYQMCEGCGLVFQNPHPSNEGYAEFYRNWYRPLISAYWGGPLDAKTIQAEQKSYAEWLVEFLDQYIDTNVFDSAVDLGGSTGIIAQAIQNAFGGRCIVVDPSPDELAEAASADLECEQALAEEWDSKGRLFDLILICRSIDHLLSISGVLKKAASALKPGGYLFVDFVDFATAAKTMADYREMLKLDHVYYLSDETMRLYLSQAGFEPLKSDFAVYQPAFLAAYTGQTKVPLHQTPYSFQMGALLRERLTALPPQPYMVDGFTRMVDRVKSSIPGRAGRIVVKKLGKAVWKFTSPER